MNTLLMGNPWEKIMGRGLAHWIFYVSLPLQIWNGEIAQLVRAQDS